MQGKVRDLCSQLPFPIIINIIILDEDRQQTLACLQNEVVKI